METEVQIVVEDQNNTVLQLKTEFYKAGITLGINTEAINIILS